MDCPNCGIENKQDAVFCMSCGTPLPGAPFSQLKKEEHPRRPPDATAAPPAAPPPQAPAPEPVTMPAQTPPAPAAPRQETPPAPAPPAETRSVVEEILAAPGTQAAPPPQVPAPEPATMPAQTPPAPAAPRQEAAKPAYYVPPEADYVEAASGARPVPEEKVSAAEEPVPAAPRSLDSTQTIAPIAAAGRVAGRERRAVCPECYAPNPEGNSYCQECGNALPVTSGRPAAAARPAPAQAAPQKTTVMPPADQAGTAARPAYSSEMTLARAARGDKAFGAADILALLALGAGAVAVAFSFVIDSFTWKKGLDISMFSHQGAYTAGRTDLLGGPGILPYEGVEFFTVGLVVAVALGLALVFLAVRTGRGPMFMLSGCALLLPAAYIFFQAVLPLRQMGIEVDPAVGLGGMFFGNETNAGMGLSFWLTTAAGALLVLAGFIAPPRGWGRLLTFALFLAAVLGISFFCAASFNWNLFISEAAAVSPGAGRLTAGTIALLLPPLL